MNSAQNKCYNLVVLLIVLYVRKTLATWSLGTNAGCRATGIAGTRNCQGVFFPTADIGYVVGDQGFAMKTINGGTAWSLLTTGQSAMTFKDICCTDALACVAVGVEGAIRTTDGGSTWTGLVDTSNLKAIDIWGTKACAVGETTAPAGIIRCTNDFTTWTTYLTTGAEVYNDIKFTDANTAYVVGNSGVMYKTTDGGANWNQVTHGTGVTDNLNGVDFPQGQVNAGFVVGAGGVILKTSDAGSTWSTQTSGTLEELYGVSFFNANTGKAVGENRVLSTTDSGVTWTILGGTSSGAHRAVFMRDVENAKIVGDQIMNAAEYTAPTPSPSPTPTPTPSPGGDVYGDPIAYYNGKKTEFWLPMDTLTLLLQTSDMRVLASPLPGEGKEQWIGHIFVSTPSGHPVVTVDIKRDLVNFNASTVPTDAFETLNVLMGPAVAPLTAMPPPDAYYTHESGLHLMFGRTSRQPGPYPRREGVVVIGSSAKIHIVSSSAREYYGEGSPLSTLYAHLDFQVFDMQGEESFGGILPELWGVKPLSSETAAMVKEASAEPELV